MKYGNELSDKEKQILMRSIFENQSKSKIKNIGDFISDNFSKIDGFDFRWTSLITNKPLLFEDIDYLRVRDYIDNQITDDEIIAYKNGELRDLYATFDNLLVCNLKYYDRIMSFCTMVFLRYVRIDGNLIGIDSTDKNIPHLLSMTPTQIWCAVMSNTESSEWELNYAWSHLGFNIIKHKNPGVSLMEQNFQRLYQNKLFKYFAEYSAARNATQGYRETFLYDKTSNRKLAQVCSKFTKTSVAISEQQLDTIYKYSIEIERVKQKLYDALNFCLSTMFNGDSSQYSVYVFQSEYYIFCSKFSMKVSKDVNGKITKDYLANSYECFAAEEFLIPSIKTQIEWAKYKLEAHFEYDKNILKTMLTNMLENNFREIICINKMNDFGVVSKITFKGVFSNVTIIEDFMLDNRTIKTETKTLSKRNAANWIVDKGYCIFGTEEDVYRLNEEEKITKSLMVKHYTNYCIPVLNYMFDIIATHIMSKNDIIDFVVSDVVNPNKFNNHNIKYTSISKIEPRQILADKLRPKQGKSYWKTVE